LPGLVLTCNPPYLSLKVARITGMSHWCSASFRKF
jgi:hypothetical protein